MIITLCPVAEPIGHPFADALELSRAGQTLTINGQALDFSVIPNGATLPDAEKATGCPYIVGDIDRDSDGTLRLTIRLPHAHNAPYEARFPESIINPSDGIVALPETGWPTQKLQEETHD